MKFDYLEYTLGTQWITLLFNGDGSGLEEGEEALFDAWYEAEKLPEGGHFDFVSDDEGEYEESYFGEDEVTGMRGDVVDLRYFYPAEENEDE